jgi:hypothetical protein
VSIYVQIPAYRDSELPTTLLDLYAKADQPEALRVCLVWQHGLEETLGAAVRGLPRLEVIEVPYEQSRGCNWARNLLQSKWHGEEHTLLLDSHHRFVAGWDRTLVYMYESLRTRGVERPLLTAYLPAYEPRRDPEGRKRAPTKLYPFGREDGILTRLTSYPIPFWRSINRPVPADYVSLHFLFTAGRFNMDIPADPDLYFFGDEVATGLRAYTWGYEFFHPHVVLGWHSYDRATRVPHWDDHKGWRSQHQRSLEKLRALFSGDGPPGQLGSSRTVADYNNHVMVRLVEAG